MSENDWDDEETNVEGLVCAMLSITPFNDPLGCENIIALYTESVRGFLANRASRHRRDGDAA